MRHLDQCPPAHTHRPSGPARNLKKQRSRRPVTKSQLLSCLRQTPRGTLRPRVPREQCPVLPTSQGPANLRKKGPLGNQSIVLATCRTWTSTVSRTTSLTRGSRAPGTHVPWSAPSPSPNPSPNPRPDPDPAPDLSPLPIPRPTISRPLSHLPQTGTLSP